MVYTVGHPNASVSKAAELCDSIVAEVRGPSIDTLVVENPYYVYTSIPGGMYPGSPKPVQTFGVVATVVTSTQVSSKLIYSVVKAVFENLDTLRRMHPALSELEAKNMVKDGLSAPLHQGALEYYRQIGLM
jgi:TRAP transporter TAXI family solute receptor